MIIEDFAPLFASHKEAGEKVKEVLQKIGIVEEIEVLPFDDLGLETYAPGTEPAFVDVKVGLIECSFDLTSMQEMLWDWQTIFDENAPEGATVEWMIATKFAHAVLEFADLTASAIVHVHKYVEHYTSKSDEDFRTDEEVFSLVLSVTENKLFGPGKYWTMDFEIA